MQKIDFLNRYFIRAKKILDAEGWAGLLRKATHRILRRPLIASAYVLARQIKNEPMILLPQDEIIVTELKGCDEDEIESVAAFGFYGNSKSDILRFLADGQKCWIAKYNSLVVSCVWVLTGVFFDAYLKRYIILAENEEYMLGAFTLPGFRGMGILPYLVSQSSLSRFRNNPHLREFVIVRMNNAPSLATCRKLGFVIIGNIGFVDLLGLRLNYLTGRDAFPETTKRILLQFFV